MHVEDVLSKNWIIVTNRDQTASAASYRLLCIRKHEPQYAVSYSGKPWYSFANLCLLTSVCRTCFTHLNMIILMPTSGVKQDSPILVYFIYDAPIDKKRCKALDSNGRLCERTPRKNPTIRGTHLLMHTVKVMADTLKKIPSGNQLVSLSKLQVLHHHS